MIKNIIYLTTVLLLSSCSSTNETIDKSQNKAVSLTTKTKCECKNINESIVKPRLKAGLKNMISNKQLKNC